MNPDRHGIYNVFVRLRPENMSATIDLLKQTWESVAPNIPFRLAFLDENLENQYRNEQRWQKIVTYASIFAIIISCLGLLGLASLAVTRRTKEIGIRKVLGASAAGIVGVVSKDFVKLMLIANLIAWPVAYVAMNTWLQNFAYRIDIGWWVFMLAGGLALLIALLTVSTQALRAALANPAEALRYE
jgi:putative ABC transport system permease protein